MDSDASDMLTVTVVLRMRVVVVVQLNACKQCLNCGWAVMDGVQPLSEPMHILWSIDFQKKFVNLVPPDVRF